MRGVDLSDNSGLYSLRISVLKLQKLHGHSRVDDDFSTEISKIDDILSHTALLIVIESINKTMGIKYSRIIELKNKTNQKKS